MKDWNIEAMTGYEPKTTFYTYQKLWLTLDGWCQENLKGDDLAYYYRTTD